jgi:predicted transcriptional regulator
VKVHLSHDLENKRARAADRRGVSIEVLAREAIERVVNDDEWFIREVEAGLDQIDAGRCSRTKRSVRASRGSSRNTTLAADVTPVTRSAAGPRSGSPRGHAIDVVRVLHGAQSSGGDGTRSSAGCNQVQGAPAATALAAMSGL